MRVLLRNTMIGPLLLVLMASLTQSSALLNETCSRDDSSCVVATPHRQVVPTTVRRYPFVPAASLTAFFDAYSVVAVASLSASAKLLSSVGLGSLAAKHPQILDAAAISALSRLTYWIFQPAFLLTSVSSTLASSSGTDGIAQSLLWMLPLASMAQIALGALVSQLLTKNMELAEARDVTMCTTFGNAGPLPLMFADALFKGKLQTDVAACISFYLIAWSPLFWTFGKVILGTYGKNSGSNMESSSVSLRMMQEIRKFLSPPVTGSILGVLVGSVPFLRKLFMGGLASPVYSACKSLGTAYLPAALLVLAGSLVQSFSSSSPVATSSKLAPPSTGVSRKTLGSILLSRFFLAPLLSLATFRIMDYVQWLGSGRSRAIVSFVVLMEGCMPSAQNSVIMLQLEGMQERAGIMAKILAILYTSSVIPVTILLSGCLALSGILNYA